MQKETVDAMLEEGKEFHAVAYEMEIERVQYMLNSYHRCRLQKVCAALVKPSVASVSQMRFAAFTTSSTNTNFIT